MTAHWSRVVGCVVLAAMLAACGGGGSDDGGGSGGSGGATGAGPVGPAGGTVSEASGARVVVPAGALSTTVQIGVAQTAAGAPALPAGLTLAGPVYAFTPHGTTFAVPTTITVPFDPASVPAGTPLALYKTDATQSTWAIVPGATSNGSSMSGQVSGFSYAVVAQKSPADEILKMWSLKGFEVGSTPFGATPKNPKGFSDEGTQLGGLLGAAALLGGPLPVRPVAVAGDQRALVQVFSDETGKRYWTAVEAPVTDPAAADPMNMAVAMLTQSISYVKKQPDAKLKYVISVAQDEIIYSRAQPVDPKMCPWLAPGADSDTIKRFCTEVLTNAGNAFEVEGWRAGANKAFFLDSRGMFLSGLPNPGRKPKLIGGWTLANDFDFNDDVDGDGSHRHAVLKLRHPVTIEVPLNNIPVGEVFTVTTTARSDAINHIGGSFDGGAYVGSSLVDPARSVGIDVVSEGIEEVPFRNDFPSAPVAEPCTSGIDPAAGTVEFSSPDFPTLERPADALIFVQRTGGTKGDISVLVETQDETALAGSDYKSVRRTLRFADGGDGSAIVFVPILADAIAEPDKTVKLTLTLLSGCAALGTQPTATLTIIDDDRPLPVTPTFALGGTVSGLAGSGLVLKTSGFDQVQLAGNGTFTFPRRLPDGTAWSVSVGTQPVNPAQVCTVTNGSGTIAGSDVANIQVDCATPPPVTGLDPTFGALGKVFDPTRLVTTLARQADGKLLTLDRMKLTRYNADGSPDATFGTGGRVTIVARGGSTDTMKALALQPDGRILVAGFAATLGQNNDDFAVLRFNTDGSPDLSFGTQGLAITDFDGLNDAAIGVFVQPDGKIVAAGHAMLGPLVRGNLNFAAARYLADGSPDPTFGVGGKATLDFGLRSEFANAAALQPDGKIVVAGRVFADNGTANADMGVARFTAGGVADTTFGSQGTGTLRIDFGAGGIVPVVFDGGDWDEALDVVLQPDGQIVVGGFRASGGVTNAALARLTSDGRLDTTFGTFGLAVSNATSRASGIALQADGKIVLVGPATGDFVLARLTAAGAADTTFNGNGILSVDFFAASDVAADVLIQPDGRIVVGGTALSGTAGGGGLIRVLP